jgi:hypothetical protein
MMKRGGQPGHIAINADRVTYVCSSSGPFTDVHFGEHKVAVEGTLEQVVAKLTGDTGALNQPAVRSWIKTG